MPRRRGRRRTRVYGFHRRMHDGSGGTGGFSLREDGGFALREDGSKELRE